MASRELKESSNEARIQECAFKVVWDLVLPLFISFSSDEVSRIRGGYYAGGEEVYLMGVKLNKRAGDSGDLEEDRKKKEAHMEEHPGGGREAKLKFDLEAICLIGSIGCLTFRSLRAVREYLASTQRRCIS